MLYPPNVRDCRFGGKEGKLIKLELVLQFKISNEFGRAGREVKLLLKQFKLTNVVGSEGREVS
jgi:hypothetical protein